MKRYCALILILGAGLPLFAQMPDAHGQQQELDKLIRDLQAQQTQIIDNQTKIEAKMAELTETMRVARIFAGRAGR